MTEESYRSEAPTPGTRTLVALLIAAAVMGAAVLVTGYLPQSFVVFPALLAVTVIARLLARFVHAGGRADGDGVFYAWVRACATGSIAALAVAVSVTAGLIDGSVGLAVSAYTAAAILMVLAIHTRYIARVRHRERQQRSERSQLPPLQD